MIHAYAEYLENIDIVSLQVTLDGSATSTTRFVVAEDGAELRIHHQDQQESLHLPARVEANVNLDNALSTFGGGVGKTLNFRLKARKSALGCPSALPNVQSDLTPWSAPQLTAHTEIRCKTCKHSVLLRRGSISDWRDLPSEGWAEMMDFWHCHKPDTPETTSVNSHGKGYAANSRLALQAGVGMVARLDFVLTSTDCEGVKEESATSESALRCAVCDGYVGTIDPDTNAFRLYKPCVAVSNEPNQAPHFFQLEKWLASLFLAAVETQGVRKFVVQRKRQGAGDARLIWIFVASIAISSSTLPADTSPMRAVKILHQPHRHVQESLPLLNSKNLTIGEIDLLDSEVTALFDLLDRSRALLPPNPDAQRFHDWDVGLLHLFQPADLAS